MRLIVDDTPENTPVITQNEDALPSARTVFNLVYKQWCGLSVWTTGETSTVAVRVAGKLTGGDKNVRDDASGVFLLV